MLQSKSRVSSGLEPQRSALPPSVISVLVAVLLLAFASATRSQESPDGPQSVAQAAQDSRAHQANSTKRAKVITNEDPGFRYAPSAAIRFSLQSSITYGVQAPNVPASCDNPAATRLTRELQAAQEELDHLRRQLSVQPEVISDGDLDLQYFKPGYSGFYVGASPLLESEAPAPARVAAAELEERVAYLEKALRTVCEPPEAARIQMRLDELEEELNLLQREFALDQDAYYSKPDYAGDTAGRARLDVEQQQIAALQSEIESLKKELADLAPTPIAQ